VTDASWDEAIAALAGALGRHAPDEVGVLASPQMANEDLFALRRLLEGRGVRRVAFRVPPAAPGDQDDFLIRADKNPNTRGAELLGLDGDAAAILAAARARQVKSLWIFGHDLLASGLPAADAAAALAAAETVVWVGANANATSARAHWVLPAAAWVERDGTFTSFEGRVQRFRQAVEPLGQALPEWEILGRLLEALGAGARPPRAERWFRELAAAVPAFAGLTYQSIGDVGTVLAR
jgi:NADH-quinone oxidoreductase subunit G